MTVHSNDDGSYVYNDWAVEDCSLTFPFVVCSRNWVTGADLSGQKMGHDLDSNAIDHPSHRSSAIGAKTWK